MKHLSFFNCARIKPNTASTDIGEFSISVINRGAVEGTAFAGGSAAVTAESPAGGLE